MAAEAVERPVYVTARQPAETTERFPPEFVRFEVSECRFQPDCENRSLIF